MEERIIYKGSANSNQVLSDIIFGKKELKNDELMYLLHVSVLTRIAKVALYEGKDGMKNEIEKIRSKIREKVSNNG